MEWQRHREAAPGKRPLASARGCSRAHSLEGLEPKAPSTSLHVSVAPSAGGYSDGIGLFASLDLDAANTFSDTASAFSAHVGRAPETECASSNWGQVKITLFGVPD